MSKDCFKLFSQEFAQSLSDSTLLITDRVTTHQSGLLAHTDITLQHLPTACRELNPVERVFKELRKKLANRVFHSLQQAEQILSKALQELIEQPVKLISLTNYVLPNLN